MPLMPAPPMPTKCTRLTLCFIARASSRHTSAATRAPHRACRARARASAIARARGRSSRRRMPASRSARQRVLRLLPCGAGVDQELRIGALLVGDRARQRHDDGAQAHGGEFGHRQRAAAADHEVGPRVARRHVVDERDALAVDAGRAYAARSAAMCFSPA